MTMGTDRTISKSQLKAKMLEVFREIEQTGQPLIVTDHRRPVLKIVPINGLAPVEEVFAEFQAKLHFHEDENATTEEEWEALS